MIVGKPERIGRNIRRCLYLLIRDHEYRITIDDVIAFELEVEKRPQLSDSGTA